jgi:hypothetical protein
MLAPLSDLEVNMSLSGILHASLGLAVLGIGGLALAMRKQKGWHTWLGEAYHWLWLVMAILALVNGAEHPGISPFEIITIPSYVGALIGYLMGKFRLRLSANWLRWHIQGLASSYIAVITALGFQIALRVLPYEVYQQPLVFWTIMLAPGLIGGQFVGRTIEKWTGKRVKTIMAEPAQVMQPKAN